MTFSRLREFAASKPTLDNSDPSKRAESLFRSILSDIAKQPDIIQFDFDTLSWIAERNKAAFSPWEEALVDCQWASDVEEFTHACMYNEDRIKAAGLKFFPVWTHVDYRVADDTIRTSFYASIRDARKKAAEEIARSQGKKYSVVRPQVVHFFTFDGPGYNFPDLIVAGPSDKSDVDAELPDVGVHVFELDDASRSVYGETEDEIARVVEQLLSPLRGDDWKSAFRSSFETRSKARNYFTEKLQGALSDIMRLLADCTDSALDSDGEYAAEELEALHATSVLLAFRLMFLHEFQRRGLLFTDPLGDDELKFDEFLSTDIKKGAWEPGDFIARVMELSDDIDNGRDELAVGGASIFRDLPDKRTFDGRIAELFDGLRKWLASSPDEETATAWDQALKETGQLLVGKLERGDEEDSHVETGAGAAEVPHRVLGNIYEQMLALIPDTDDDGNPHIRKPDKDSDEKSEQQKLAAHYTPRDIVSEVVRPTLGKLFEHRFEKVEQDPEAYLEELKDLKIVDPAMGSGHFLSLAALEIAREIAWVKHFGGPRPFEWHLPSKNPNPIGVPPEDFEKGTIQKPQPKFDPPDGPEVPDVDEDAFDRTVSAEIPGVVRRSIYGVDKNPLAVELGKLSLWLFSATEAERATADPDADDSIEDLKRTEIDEFLDSNIKCGDSLVGVFLRTEDSPAVGLDHYDSVEDILDNAARSSGQFDDPTGSLWSWQKESLEDRIDKITDLRRAMKARDTDMLDIVEQSNHLKTTSDAFLEEYFNLVEEQAKPHHRRRALYDACNKLLDDVKWLYNLAVAIKYIGYTSGSHVGKDTRRPEQLAEIVLGDIPENGVKGKIESEIADLLKDPFSDDAKAIKSRLDDWIENELGALGVRPFHWELEFREIFSSEEPGFDAAVANPPFIGDRDLKGRLGGEDAEELVSFIADYFIPGDKKSEYAGFFFHRYNEIVASDGAFGSLSTNSIGQASNRAYVTKPLTNPADGVGDAPAFGFNWVAPNRKWPGRGVNVHFAQMTASRPALGQDAPGTDGPIFVEALTQSGENLKAFDDVATISSFLDRYPDFDLAKMTAAYRGFHQGFILRGNFSIRQYDGEPLDEALARVPENERDALAAYLNADDVQQNPEPTPSDIVIDFFEPLRQEGLGEADSREQLEFLEDSYSFLLEHLREYPEDESLYEYRTTLPESSSNEEHIEKWYLFGSVRQGLRGGWDDTEITTLFPIVVKVWSPVKLTKEVDFVGRQIRICPMHKHFVSPMLSNSQRAVTSSMLFEGFVRRRCGSLKSDLNFSNTDVFPYFPWPWRPQISGGELTVGEPNGNEYEETRQQLESAIDRLEQLRTDILANLGGDEHDLSDDQIGGPTDLYNVYDSDPDGEHPEPNADNDSIEALRHAHVDLLEAVLRAYARDAENAELPRDRRDDWAELAAEWSELADRCNYDGWDFERPWLDRTQRFVPKEPLRAKMFELIDRHNTLRAEQELAILGGPVYEVLTEDERTTKGHYEAFTEAGFDIDRDVFDAVVAYLIERGRIASLSPDEGMPYHGSNWSA